MGNVPPETEVPRTPMPLLQHVGGYERGHAAHGPELDELAPCEAQEPAKAGQTASARPGAQDWLTAWGGEEERSWQHTGKTNTASQELVRMPSKQPGES